MMGGGHNGGASGKNRIPLHVFKTGLNERLWGLLVSAAPYAGGLWHSTGADGANLGGPHQPGILTRLASTVKVVMLTQSPDDRGHSSGARSEHWPGFKL